MPYGQLNTEGKSRNRKKSEKCKSGCAFYSQSICVLTWNI